MNHQIVLITGVSSGIGFYLAFLLSQKNYKVYGILRNLEKFRETLRNSNHLKNEIPSNLVILETDVRNYDKINDIVNMILKENQRIDILINNAGYGLYGAFEEFNETDFREQFETNFFAPLYLIKKILPSMRERKQGKIINITSILGKVNIPAGSAYCSSKHAFVSVTEVLHYELAPFGIQICSVEPGLVKTDFKHNMKFSKQLESEQSPYYKLNSVIKKELQKYPPYAMSPEKAAHKILELIEKEKIPLHYEIGIDAKIVSLISSFFPDSAKDFVINEYLKKIKT